MYKIQIFPKNETFLNDLLIFLFEKSIEFRRNFHIDNILNSSVSLQHKYDFIKSTKIIDLQNVYGSTFQSYHRTNENIYAISHTITQIVIEDDFIYGIVKPNDYGEIIDFEKGILRPVYFRPDKESVWKIATFDIDFNIIDNAA